MHVLDDISLHIDRQFLCQSLRIKEGSERAAELDRMIEEAESIGKPRGVYREVFIDSKKDSGVVIEGIAFESRVLRINLETAERVFPLVATCGRELEEWGRGFDDMLLRYFADTIQATAMGEAFRAIAEHLGEEYRPGKTSTMSPGSLTDWPISEQQKLFQLLGDTEKIIGVSLTESFCMIPLKSISALLFPTEVDFQSCQLCKRENCPGRRAPYDAHLHEMKYGKL